VSQLRSLRSLLSRQVLWPLAMTWTLGTVVTLAVSLFFTQQAFDRAMLDDAYAIASRVSNRQEGLTLDLSTREMGALLFDQSESVYFSVMREDGSLMAGHPGLRAPWPEGGKKVLFDDISYQGKELRSVVLVRSQPEPFVVLVAQTQGSRLALLRSVLLLSVVPQVLLLLALAVWLRVVIGRELAPLTSLQRSVGERDARDLTPLTVSTTTQEMASLGAAINALLARLGDSLRAQREFSGNVAHELRTPLAGIRALTEYGLAHQDAVVMREQLQRIAASEARASRLVEQLLALALAEETDVSLPAQWVDLDALVRDTLMRYLPRADALGVDLGAQGLDQGVQVWVHAGLLEGALGNLIDNALRHGRWPEGAAPQPQARVTVTIDPHPTEVCLTVVDNGPGLSPEQCRQYVQRGVRGPHQGRLATGAHVQGLGEGAGLGLAIVARFASLMPAAFTLGPAPQGPGLCATLVLARQRHESVTPPT
jgi:two-component system sensor histidine kinase TctE